MLPKSGPRKSVLDDGATYALLARGDYQGIFGFEDDVTRVDIRQANHVVIFLFMKVD